MVKKRIVDVLESQDSKTRIWKSSFVAGRMAYEEGKLREALTAMTRTLHRAKAIPVSHERQFAEATTHMGLGAIELAAGKTKQSREHLDRAISVARTSKEKAFQELYGISLRFYADSFVDSDDQNYTRAEELLLESIEILEDLGTDAALFLADSISDLCALYVMQDKYDKVEDYIGTAITIYRTVVGIEDLNYYRSVTLHKIASKEVEEEADVEEIVENALTQSAYQASLKHPHLLRFAKRYCHYLEQKGDKENLERLHAKFNNAFV